METVKGDSLSINVDISPFPAVFQAGNGMEIEDFIKYYKREEEEIGRLLLDKGAILFRGLPIHSKETFQYLVDSLALRFIDYLDATSPRTKLSGNVYTSTEFTNTRSISMHNELSYSAKWPGKLFFCCIQTAETGGETTLAEGRKIMQKMDPCIVDEIEKRQLRYVRNLHSGSGIGHSWQHAFETTDRRTLEDKCKMLSIQYRWKAKDQLELVQTRKGVVHHPRTRERFWFNQIDQFHPSTLGAENYKAFLQVFGKEENFPMYVCFGDGGRIPDEMVNEILQTIDSEVVANPWTAGDLLLLDNLLVLHGRRPYTGKREVLVSMTE
jgi:alpha-ketoglutarate-dependent taurine dioxygenase